MTWSTSFLFLDKSKKQKSSNCSFFSSIVRQGFHYDEIKRSKILRSCLGPIHFWRKEFFSISPFIFEKSDKPSLVGAFRVGGQL